MADINLERVRQREKKIMNISQPRESLKEYRIYPFLHEHLVSMHGIVILEVKC